jgi:hypothetical protein
MLDSVSSKGRIHKTFFISNLRMDQARLFVLDKPFQPSLMFTSKAGYPIDLKGAPLLDWNRYSSLFGSFVSYKENSLMHIPVV